MPEPSSRRVPVRRFSGGEARDDTDQVAVEEPLEIRVAFPGGPVDGESLLVTMRTPGHDEELARGLLFAEGLVAETGDVTGFVVGDPGEGRGNRLTLEVRAALRERLATSRRSFYVNSSCGICGKASIEALGARARFALAPGEPRMSAAMLAALPAALAARQPAFTATGGLHAAALFAPDGAIVDVREDVGRHNAVDKLVGAALAAGAVPLDGRVLVLSGRAGYELLEKAVLAGAAVVVAVSAPSRMAIDVAERFGVTLCGFVRGGRVNVYSHGWRVR